MKYDKQKFVDNYCNAEQNKLLIDENKEIDVYIFIFKNKIIYRNL